MRILVMFDLPTGSKAERKTYTEFRKFLLEDGYAMSQYSVYTRTILGTESMETHVDRLKKHAPSAGRITVMTLTEKQYEGRIVLCCSQGYENKELDPGEQLTLFF